MDDDDEEKDRKSYCKYFFPPVVQRDISLCTNCLGDGPCDDVIEDKRWIYRKTHGRRLLIDVWVGWLVLLTGVEKGGWVGPVQYNKRIIPTYSSNSFSDVPLPPLNQCNGSEQKVFDFWAFLFQIKLSTIQICRFDFFLWREIQISLSTKWILFDKQWLKFPLDCAWLL